MRPRVVVVVLAVLFLLIVAGIVLRRGRLGPVIHNPSPARGTPGSAIPSVKETPAGPEAATATDKPDPVAARRVLGRTLGALSSFHWLYTAHGLEEMHGGAYPEYQRFSREFLAAAGRDVVPLVTTLLEECKSSQARFLLVSVLGDARKPESVPLLKKILEGEPCRGLTKSALFSIGMSNSDEGFSFLSEFFQSGKSGDPNDPNSLDGAVLVALAQQGERSLDILLEEARRRTKERHHPDPRIIGSIRGRDAVARLGSLARSDPDSTIRLGAAMALAATTDAAQLESLASLDPAQVGRALIAARNQPDLWTGSEAIRRKVAGQVFAAAKAPTGDFQRDSALLETAMFLPPDQSRSLMESLIAKPPRNGDRDYLVRFAGAFSDQRDLRERVYELGGAWGMRDGDCELALDQGVTRGALPGRQLHPATVQALFDVVGNPDKMEWSRQQAMWALMQSGVSETALSQQLSRLWDRPLSNQHRTEILLNVWGGVHSSMPPAGPMLGTKPDQFLAGVLRSLSEPLLQAGAAAAFYAGGPSSTDPMTQGQLDSFLRFSLQGTLRDLPSSRSYLYSYLYSTYVSHLAVHGTPGELLGLSRKALDFIPEGLDEAQKEKLTREYQETMNFAIDAIRLSSK